MSYRIIVSPVTLPVTLAQTKKYLRIGTDGDDEILELLINAATSKIEAKYHKALVARTLVETFNSTDIENAFKLAKLAGRGAFLRPAFAPIISINSVKTKNNIGVYNVNANDKISLVDNKFELNQFIGDFEIEYVAGSQNPYPDYQALILEEIAKIYANRDNEEWKNGLNASNEVKL